MGRRQPQAAPKGGSSARLFSWPFQVLVGAAKVLGENNRVLHIDLKFRQFIDGFLRHKIGFQAVVIEPAGAGARAGNRNGAQPARELRAALWARTTASAWRASLSLDR